ncbi:putative lipoate-protein ligase a [Neospora caninum Liverpool]|uniref:lipoate--protein ligase n=1 Tax=Neospora caninum (strain Liverpool) TaxID=572307 RepID=F0VJ37_NEOCL|nr:putative lipoate-protein ligase a [Neospora caninum Liverpool]CBZ53748.1 putative lipoate-protein ligase a [Neospora caninum Liverpool]CEL67740.1 TPA: lipoate-protein ligase a, putative [Neospora caninum Liverpool]|eukprot:XP_003883780.1 putative lipoate-protein ligase a [Neospora caninum Liverpool]
MSLARRTQQPLLALPPRAVFSRGLGPGFAPPFQSRRRSCARRDPSTSWLSPSVALPPLRNSLLSASAHHASLPTSFPAFHDPRKAHFSTVQTHEETHETSTAPRILSSSSSDIVENLAAECFLVDVFGRGHGLPASAGEGAERAKAENAESAAKQRTERRDLRAPLLFLWRNDKTIVIGRHQNAWSECNIQKMDESGVKLARRYTGGGAVYQDLGNTCFTFLDPVATHNKERNNKIILRALEKAFGIKCSASGRNDLVASDGRKFSGAAYSKLPHGWLHHGTVMREVDCEALGRYLTPSKEKLASKSIKSVTSRVVNLKTLHAGITHDNLCDAITDSFLEEYGSSADRNVVRGMDSVENLQLEGTEYRMREHPVFQNHFRTLSNWEWRYGHSPAFERSLSHRFPWGSFDVHVNVAQGYVTDAKIYSDCLFPDLVDAFTEAVRGCRFTELELRRAILDITLEKTSPELDCFLRDFADWLSTASQE